MRGTLTGIGLGEQKAMFCLLKHQWASIDYDWNRLSRTEKRLMTENRFNGLLEKMGIYKHRITPEPIQVTQTPINFESQEDREERIVRKIMQALKEVQ